MAIISWDVDDTLVLPPEATGRTDGRDVPSYDTIAIYRWFQSQGHRMIIQSGGGEDYARMWGEKLGLNADEYRAKKKDESIDLHFDDCIVDIGKVNIKVARYNNGKKRMVPSFRDAEEMLISDKHNIQ